MFNIAVLLTCHNREQKTLSCLRSLKTARDFYNDSHHEEGVLIFVFLTDDGCSDGTVENVKELMKGENLIIVTGDGTLYWAGGMRKAWKNAMSYNINWDYYLLLNDDTDLTENMFGILFESERFSQENYGMEGVISGVTADKTNHDIITYGGTVTVNKLLATKKRLVPNGTPQRCDSTNANILLVPHCVTEKIGIFYEGYRHGIADSDYAMMVNKAHIPMLITGVVCGYCERDHLNQKELALKITAMSLKERKAYFNNPLHSIHDYLLSIRRRSPLRYPIAWAGRMLNLYFPKIYYKLNRVR